MASSYSTVLHHSAHGTSYIVSSASYGVQCNLDILIVVTVPQVTY